MSVGFFFARGRVSCFTQNQMTFASRFVSELCCFVHTSSLCCLTFFLLFFSLSLSRFQRGQTLETIDKKAVYCSHFCYLLLHTLQWMIASSSMRWRTMPRTRSMWMPWVRCVSLMVYTSDGVLRLETPTKKVTKGRVQGTPMF